jgi:hypothetical protein
MQRQGARRCSERDLNAVSNGAPTVDRALLPLFGAHATDRLRSADRGRTDGSPKRRTPSRSDGNHPIAAGLLGPVAGGISPGHQRIHTLAGLPLSEYGLAVERHKGGAIGRRNQLCQFSARKKLL